MTAGSPSVEGLPSRRPRSIQGHDARDPRVHPPVPEPCAAQRFHRIRHYGLFANTFRADNIARARKLLAVQSPATTMPPMPAAPMPASADPLASLPVLRRPHDHHRDLRAWTRAAISTDRSDCRDQDRHLMTSAPKPPHWKAARPRSWISTGHDGARRDIASPPVLARQSSFVDPARLLAGASPAHGNLRNARSQRCCWPRPRSNPHSARGADSLTIAVSSLEVFVRRPRSMSHHRHGPASENLHKTGKAQNEQMFSGLPPIADIAATCRHVADGPKD